MKAWKLSPLALALFSINSFAVEPEGIALGSGVTFLPAVDLNVESNSNIYSTENDETSDIITRLTPNFGLAGDFGKTKVNANYRAEQGVYGDDKNDDYLDQKINAGVAYEINSRNAVSADASYNDAHDNRGSGTIEGSAAPVDPDEYNETTGAVSYLYGADSAVGNLELSADVYQKRYDNNKALFNTTDRDHDKVSYGAVLSLTSSPTNEVILEAKQIDINYSNSTNVAKAREGYEQRLFVGMRWDITGKTTGEAKIGRSARFFDDNSKSSNTRLAWNVNLTWEPMTYSTVKIMSSQSSNETNGAGDYIANTYSSANWEHAFSAYYKAGITASISSDVYVSDVAGRKDDVVSYGINGTYSPKKWMDVTLSYSQAERDSNIVGLDYDNQIIALGLSLAI